MALAPWATVCRYVGLVEMGMPRERDVHSHSEGHMQAIANLDDVIAQASAPTVYFQIRTYFFSHL